MLARISRCLLHEVGDLRTSGESRLPDICFEEPQADRPIVWTSIRSQRRGSRAIRNRSLPRSALVKGSDKVASNHPSFRMQSCQVRRPMQCDDGFSGARRTRDLRRAGVFPFHQLALFRVEKYTGEVPNPGSAP
jgi:hypothetical protein